MLVVANSESYCIIKIIPSERRNDHEHWLEVPKLFSFPLASQSVHNGLQWCIIGAVQDCKSYKVHSNTDTLRYEN